MLRRSSKPPRKRRGVRRGPPRSEQFRRWVGTLPCLVCGNPETQAAHTEHGGTSMKGSDFSCVPLCCTKQNCHGQFDGRVKMPNGEYGNGKSDGWTRFERFYGVDLKSRAEGLYGVWLLKHGGKNGNGSNA